MPTDSNTLLGQATCLDCAIPPGMLLPVWIVLFANIAGVSTDPNTLINMATCIDCNIPPGMQLPVLIALADRINSQSNCVNVIPVGATYSGLNYLIPNIGDLPISNYLITWGANESQLVNNSGTPPLINNPGAGQISFYSTSPFASAVITTTTPNALVTAKVCAI